jgi:hypothetical protein
MPKTPIDFSKTIIYKIWKDDDFYVGSTTDYSSRKYSHKHNCINEKLKAYNVKLYQTIRDKGGWDSWEMTPLEEYVECKSKIQAIIKEEEWRVKLNASLNTNKAFISETIQEYQKHYHKSDKVKAQKAQYRQEHADEIKAQIAQYREKNADKIKAQKAKYYKEHANEINEKRRKK